MTETNDFTHSAGIVVAENVRVEVKENIYNENETTKNSLMDRKNTGTIRCAHEGHFYIRPKRERTN